MDNLKFTIIASLAGLAGLGLLVYFSPHGFARLKHFNFWLLVICATLPPLVITVWGMTASEDPALWLMMSGMATIGSFLFAFGVGLFIPANLAWWWSLVFGFVPWLGIGLFTWLRN